MMRLFVAIALEQTAARQVVSLVDTLRENSRGGTFTRRENLHITLAFLGEALAQRDARAAVEAVEAQPFSLVLEGIGRFRQRDGDLYWLGAQPNRALEALYRQVSQNLAAKGFQVDRRPFHPHITLGRRVELVKGFEPIAYGKKQPAITSKVNRICLMDSRRGGNGPVYTAVAEKRLEGAM